MLRTLTLVLLFTAALPAAVSSHLGNRAAIPADGLMGVYSVAPANQHNLVLWTEGMDNILWTKTTGGVASAAVVTANYATAPDGTTTAERLQLALNGGSTSTDLSMLIQTVPNLPNPHDMTVSAWMKSNTGSSYAVDLHDGSGTGHIVTVTPSWQRFVTSYSALASTNATVSFALRGTWGTADSADILVWGANASLTSKVLPYERADGTLPLIPQMMDNLAPLRYRENQLAYSEQLGHAGWTATGVTVSSDAATAPDGTPSAEDAAVNTNGGGQNLSTATPTGLAGQYTASVYFAAHSATHVQLEITGQSTSLHVVDCNAATGTVSDISGSGGKAIFSVGNGWYRCSANANVVADTIKNVNIYPTGASQASGDSVYVWGAQLNAGSTARTYQATNDLPWVQWITGPRKNVNRLHDLSKWSWLRSYYIPGATLAPDGSYTGYFLGEDTSNNSHVMISPTWVGYGAGTYIFSAFVKPGVRTWAYLSATVDGISRTAYFDAQNCAVGTLGGTAIPINATAVAVANGWCRISFKTQAVNAVSSMLLYIAQNSSTTSFQGVPADGVYVWGVQVEQVPFTPKAYAAGTVATNVLPSNTDTLSGWSTSNLTYTGSGTADPVGGTSASTLAATSGAIASLRYTATLTSATLYTATLYLKAGTVSTASVSLYGAAAIALSTFDLNACLATTTTNGLSTITRDANGYCRISVTGTTNQTSNTFYIYPRNSTGALNGDTIYVYGAQLYTDALPVASSYQNGDQLMGMQLGATTAAEASDPGMTAASDGTPTYQLTTSQYLITPNLTAAAVRRNLMTATSTFTTSWGTSNAGTGVLPTITANYAAAPDGTTTAQRVQLNPGGSTLTLIGDYSIFAQGAAGTLPLAGGNTVSVWAKSTDGVSTYTVALREASFSPQCNMAVTGTWQRFSCSGFNSGTTNNWQVLVRGTWSTSNTADILIWGPQEEMGYTMTPYQPITTAVTSGLEWPTDWTAYLLARFDGSSGSPLGIGSAIAVSSGRAQTTSSGVLVVVATGGSNSANLAVSTTLYTLIAVRYTQSTGALTMTRLDTGTTVTAGTAVPVFVAPRFAIGARPESTVTSLVSSMKVAWFALYNRVTTTAEDQRIYRKVRMLYPTLPIQ